MTDYLDLVRRAYTGRRFVSAFEVLVPAAMDAKRLQDLGCEAMATGATRGTGDLPPEVEAIEIGMSPARSMMEGIRSGLRALEHLPAGVLSRIEAFDPDHTARVMMPFFATAHEIAGRRVW